MASFIQLLIIAAALTAVLGQKNYTDRVTNGTQDYFKIAQAELLYKVKISEIENDAVDARFLDRLTVIEQQQQQVLNETKQVNQTLIPLQALNLIRKYCIQTYDSQFLTHEYIKEKFRTCINQVKNSGISLTTNAKSFTSTARTYATYNLPRNLNTYCTSYTNQTKLEQCYIQYVEDAVDNVDKKLINAKSSREQSIFDMDRISLIAVQCSYSIEKNVLANNAITLQKINDCVDDLTRRGVSGNKKALN